ncbi:heme peroxidase [Lobulomyces angularis]|nr:heme peroxidase [Lobulomyces angularis]
MHQTQQIQFQAVRDDIKSILANPDWDDGSLGPVFVRLAWHAAGTYDKTTKTGGTNGATMRFKPESSAKHDWISYADLWTLAGVVAVEEMSNGQCKVPWEGGRSDKNEKTITVKDIPPNGRLPDAAQGAPHIREVFYRMGFTDREIVALLGAHALGRCHTDRSGYDGPWTFTPTKLSNQFYILLLRIKWEKREWDGPEQYKDPKDKLMMLPSDIALIEDPVMKPIVKEYAEDKELFFKDFAQAFGKLLELGVNRNASRM